MNVKPPILKHRIDLDFEAVKLPPVRDVLVLGKKYPQGKEGVMAAFRFVAPDEFEMFDVPEHDETVEAVLINRRILKRLPSEAVLQVLREHVFPLVAAGEAINVNLNVKVTVAGIEVRQS